jgi:hypothetical protein
MAHTFTFTISVELARESGKFMARDEMSDLLIEAIEGSDPGEISGGADGDSVYSVMDFTVTEA